jgi:hypothetical protein
MPENLIGYNIFKEYRYRRGDFFPLPNLLTPLLFVPRASLQEIRAFGQIDRCAGLIVGSFLYTDWEKVDIGCVVFKLIEVYDIHYGGSFTPNRQVKEINLLRRV